MFMYDYLEQVDSIAENLVKAAMQAYGSKNETKEEIVDALLFRVLEGHEWIIYNAYHLDILENSKNADYMVENIGGSDAILRERGVSGLLQVLAFWALYADVHEKVHEIMSEADEE